MKTSVSCGKITQELLVVSDSDRSQDNQECKTLVGSGNKLKCLQGLWRCVHETRYIKTCGVQFWGKLERKCPAWKHSDLRYLEIQHCPNKIYKFVGGIKPRSHAFFVYGLGSKSDIWPNFLLELVLPLTKEVLFPGGRGVTQCAGYKW